MAKSTTEEVVTSVWLCLAVIGGAIYGWFFVGTISATIGGAVIIGVFALLLASVVSIAGDRIGRLFTRRGPGNERP